MTHDYIMTHTPAQIAALNSTEEIRSAFDAYTGPITLEDAANLYGDNAPEEFDDALPNVDWCEQLLTEWYDEAETERPYTAEQLAMACHLYAAIYLCEQ